MLLDLLFNYKETTVIWHKIIVKSYLVIKKIVISLIV